MLKRVGALAVIAAAFAVAVSTTAWGSAKAPARSAAATKSVTCGSLRTIGVAAPITGPVASLGGQQVAWAKYFVTGWNKTHPEGEDPDRPG